MDFQHVTSIINTLAGALYKVFYASPDEARKEIHQACFDYLSLGGVFSERPLSLLLGLNPHPLSLVAQFFAVAIYGVGIIFPVIRLEGVRQMFFPATVPAYYRSPPIMIFIQLQLLISIYNIHFQAGKTIEAEEAYYMAVPEL
ncbi:hypothetical protein NC653_008280 [Populus alba x Populus x berolinensis]|uniref:Squalene monooxygenase n=1 Tax=Populus alba x Populus x berolinensis TaxID=444605 RepID=A0AAD6R5Y2_9ROSI|nr:hypothetical protein NC653_008280 [Populus alba x Populus x berolinensis]